MIKFFLHVFVYQDTNKQIFYYILMYLYIDALTSNMRLETDTDTVLEN